MNKNLLSTLAKWAAILSFALYAVDFFNLNPFRPKDGNNKESVFIEETEKSAIEPTVNRNKHPNTKSKSNREVIDIFTARDLSLGEILLIPFKEHKKGNYLDYTIKKKYPIAYYFLYFIFILSLSVVTYALFIFLSFLLQNVNLILYIFGIVDTHENGLDLKDIILFICGIFVAWYNLTITGEIN